MEIERREFYKPQLIYEEVKKKIGEKIDYITFVPDGEPTLDINLGKIAEKLRDFNIPLAILTNSSLITEEDVQNDLAKFDFISFKLDAVSEEPWRKIDRPHKSLNLQDILNSLLDFRKDFNGKIVTETMLINGIDYRKEIQHIAEFLSDFNPDIAYIAIPTRPPAEKWVEPADEYTLNYAFAEFSKVVKTEFLIGYEGSEFSATGNFEDDILSITAVHPMREDAVLALLDKCGEDLSTLQKLVDDGKIIVVKYRGEKYYMRALPSRKYMTKG